MDEKFKSTAFFLITAVLVALLVGSHYRIEKLEGKLERYAGQREEITRFVWAEYGADIYAAINHFMETRPDVVEKLGENVEIKVDYIVHGRFGASYDPREQLFWVYYDEFRKPREEDVVYVRLTAYYPTNWSAVRGFPWMEYVVNHTTHGVIGVTGTTAQFALMSHFPYEKRQEILRELGIENATTGCSSTFALFRADGSWVDIELNCAENGKSLCWFTIGWVEEKSGKLERVVVTKPFEGSCGKEREDTALQLREELMGDSFEVPPDIVEKLLNLTGGTIYEWTAGD
ncbi:MAG: hypothetical protein PWQ79_1101 [Thermococcaceae archaeon]|nr:hypothetical protein [Thermococcaceae archaeon]